MPSSSIISLGRESLRRASFSTRKPYGFFGSQHTTDVLRRRATHIATPPSQQTTTITALVPVSPTASAIVASTSASSGGAGIRTKMFTRPRTSDRFIIFLGLTTCLSAYVFWKTNRECVFLDKTGRVRIMALSWESERKLADRLVQKRDEDTLESEFGWITSPNDYRRKEIEAIGRQIIRTAEEDFFEVRGKLDWKINVHDNTVVNAFCELGGQVTVFTGLFDLMVEAERLQIIQDARCGIACILAHEIAHGFCRHNTEKISWLPLEYPLSFLTQDSAILQSLFSFLVNLPHSRQCETEADLVGLELMARAGFDPSEAPTFFKLLDQTPEFLEWASTHPVGATRAKCVLDALPGALAVYNLNKERFTPPALPKDLYRRLLDVIRPRRKVNGRVPLSELSESEKQIQGHPAPTQNSSLTPAPDMSRRGKSKQPIAAVVSQPLKRVLVEGDTIA